MHFLARREKYCEYNSNAFFFFLCFWWVCVDVWKLVWRGLWDYNPGKQQDKMRGDTLREGEMDPEPPLYCDFIYIYIYTYIIEISCIKTYR